jgi:hypothetical protein
MLDRQIRVSGCVVAWFLAQEAGDYYRRLRAPLDEMVKGLRRNRPPWWKFAPPHAERLLGETARRRDAVAWRGRGLRDPAYQPFGDPPRDQTSGFLDAAGEQPASALDGRTARTAIVGASGPRQASGAAAAVSGPLPPRPALTTIAIALELAR